MPNKTSESHCHCGARFEGSDHCPFCGCEQYEAYCNGSYPDRHADTWWTAGAHLNLPPTPKASVFSPNPFNLKRS